LSVHPGSQRYLLGGVAAAVLVAAGAAGWWRSLPPSAPSSVPASTRPVQSRPPGPTPTAVEAASPAVTAGRAVVPELSARRDKPAKPSSQPAKPKPPIQDPEARAALSLVGDDPEAEAYWLGAINDPTLPPEERKDLIEDLNEDGLSDPHHPTAKDLPLILSRIQLIEQIAPQAMDDVNAKAFQEAYKDLTALATGHEAD
jgi:hypothetical protein